MFEQTCGQPDSPIARRARVRGGPPAITPPVRQRGIWPHSHAWLATSGCLTATPNQRFCSGRPASKRGTYRDRHERGGGMQWTRQRRARNRKSQGELNLVSDLRRARRTTLMAYGKTVWSWHPLLVSSRRRPVGPTGCGHVVNSPATVARRIRRRGERGISR